MKATKEVNPFDPETLQQTVEAELVALGWIEEITEDIRKRVTLVIQKLQKARILSVLESENKGTMEKLERVCDAVANQLYNKKELKQQEFRKLGIAKPQQEGLPETLYPAIFIQMLEQAGIPVLAFFRKNFDDLLIQKSKLGQKIFIDRVIESLAEINISTSLQARIGDSLKSLLTKPTGRKRLGELLFANEPKKLEQWYEIFPITTKEARLNEVAKNLPAAEAVVDEFLSKIKYMAGNPHTAPGIFNQFKKSVHNLVGESQLGFVTLENKRSAFTVRIRGLHSIDLERMQIFKDHLSSKWRDKFKSGEPLTIEIDRLIDGGSNGPFMDV